MMRDLGRISLAHTHGPLSSCVVLVSVVKMALEAKLEEAQEEVSRAREALAASSASTSASVEEASDAASKAEVCRQRRTEFPCLSHALAPPTVMPRRFRCA